MTPLTADGYLASKILTLTGLSLAENLLIVVITLTALRVTPLAPAFALFLAAFARNKVQSFALMKAAGVINWPPILAWFSTSSWQLAYGLCPTYWPAKVYWELEAGSPAAWIYFLVDLISLSLLVAWLARRFERAATP